LRAAAPAEHLFEPKAEKECRLGTMPNIGQFEPSPKEIKVIFHINSGINILPSRGSGFA
jgi:hypothetical protein